MHRGNMEMRFTMKMRMMVAGIALMCSAGAAMAQYAGPALTASPSGSAPASALNLPQVETAIGPGDLLAIATYGVPELTLTGVSGSGAALRVDTKGTVVLPYLGTVKLAGLTQAAASELLEKELQDAGILVNPQVTVQIVGSPTELITVVGEVKEPKPVPDFGVQLRLLDVISACGGFTPLASHTVTIHRVGAAEPITINLGVDPQSTSATNIPLLPGDTLVVPQVGAAYVVGEVQHPAAIPLTGNAPLTVVQAISMSGGLKYGAALSKVVIIRTNADRQRVEILFDLKKVMDGKEKDIALMSSDILYVPRNGFKAALSTGSTPQSAITAAIALGYAIP